MPSHPPRPRRGTPDATRQRLVDTAARIFNEVGYLGTDSNRLAKAAGYAPGTFYKHFPDKRAAFLASYEAWVAAEWQAIEALMRQERDPTKLAHKLLRQVLEHHRRWQGLRASLRALVTADADVRAYYREQRRRQLDLMARLRGRRASAATRAADAVLLYVLERVCDAVADGEVADLEIAERPLLRQIETMIADAMRA